MPLSIMKKTPEILQTLKHLREAHIWNTRLKEKSLGIASKIKFGLAIVVIIVLCVTKSVPRGHIFLWTSLKADIMEP